MSAKGGCSDLEKMFVGAVMAKSGQLRRNYTIAKCTNEDWASLWRIEGHFAFLYLSLSLVFRKKKHQLIQLHHILNEINSMSYGYTYTFHSYSSSTWSLTNSIGVCILVRHDSTEDNSNNNNIQVPLYMGIK